jgi:hypothetical protein
MDGDAAVRTVRGAQAKQSMNEKQGFHLSTPSGIPQDIIKTRHFAKWTWMEEQVRMGNSVDWGNVSLSGP